VESHAEFLVQVSLEPELAAALRRDYREADLNPQDRAMLDFTAKLTKVSYKRLRVIWKSCARWALTTGRSCTSR
jgi:hypothetical protein